MSCFIRILPMIRFSGEIVHWALELEEVKDNIKPFQYFIAKTLEELTVIKGQSYLRLEKLTGLL